jgi:adenosylhomocysteinase
VRRRDDAPSRELEWLREFTPATRGAAASLPPLGGERLLVVCHLDAKMIPYFEALARCKSGAFLANLGHTSGELPVAGLRQSVVSTPRPHVERCEVEGRTLYLLAGGAMFNLAAGPGDPYDTFDLITALMVEATGFLATEGVGYPPGVHLLPKEIQDRTARRFLGG